MTTVEASRGGVVLGILPLATAIVAALLGQERLPARFWAAALVGAGIVVAFALREGAAGLAPGDAYLVLAVLGAAVGYGLSGALFPGDARLGGDLLGPRRRAAGHGPGRAPARPGRSRRRVAVELGGVRLRHRDEPVSRFLRLERRGSRWAASRGWARSNCCRSS